MKKSVNIVEVKPLKSGSANGRSWTLWKFICEEKDDKGKAFEFTGFDSRSTGKQEVDVEKRVDGQFENWSEVKPKKPNPDTDRILNALRILNDKLDQILAK